MSISNDIVSMNTAENFYDPGVHKGWQDERIVQQQEVQQEVQEFQEIQEVPEVLEVRGV